MSSIAMWTRTLITSTTYMAYCNLYRDYKLQSEKKITKNFTNSNKLCLKIDSLWEHVCYAYFLNFVSLYHYSSRYVHNTRFAIVLTSFTFYYTTIKDYFILKIFYLDSKCIVVYEYYSCRFAFKRFTHLSIETIYIDTIYHTWLHLCYYLYTCPSLFLWAILLV